MIKIKGSLKKMVKVGNLFQQGEGGLPESQPLNRFLKKYSKCPETHNKHIFFSISRGVGLTLRNFHLLYFTIYRIYGRAESVRPLL